MTMTHSDKVIQHLSGPGSADLSAGVMTPCKKESVELVYLALQARRTLTALYKKTVHRVKREMESTGVCCDKFVRIEK